MATEKGVTTPGDFPCPILVTAEDGLHEGVCSGTLSYWEGVGRYVCNHCRRRFRVNEVLWLKRMSELPTEGRA